MRIESVRQRVLFLCTHNSARSQMAEGLLRHLAGDRFDVASAGTEATAVRPETIEAMRRRGIDIRAHSSKTLDRFVDEQWDYVITVCDAARDACPVFPGAGTRLHWSFPDPAAVEGSPSERQAAFDRTADEIERRLRDRLSG